MSCLLLVVRFELESSMNAPIKGPDTFKFARVPACVDTRVYRAKVEDDDVYIELELRPNRRGVHQTSYSMRPRLLLR